MMPIRNKAFSLLARQAYFSKQLFCKLKEKGYLEGEIKALIADFEKRGWLNDQELAARYVERQKEKGYGPRVIQMKLREKAGDLDVELIESEEPIKALLEKKYKKELPAKKDKVVAALLRRGFSYELIKQVLNAQLCD